MVDIEAVLELVVELVLDSRVLEVPHFDRVEPIVVFTWRAVCDSVLVLVIDITFAVIPHSDGIEVLQVLGAGAALESLQEQVVDVGVGYIFYSGCGIVDKIFCNRLWRALGSKACF